MTETDAGSVPQVAQVKLALNWVAEPEFGGFYAARLRKPDDMESLKKMKAKEAAKRRKAKPR